MAHRDLGEGSSLAASTGAWIVFEDEAAATLRPPKARTWSRRAHQRLHAPLIVCWDNLNTHTSATMRTFTTAHTDRLTIIQMPAYAPDLNPVEGVWATMKTGLGNLAARNVDHLTTIVRNRLKRIQYRPDLINGFLAQTGLTLDADPP